MFCPNCGNLGQFDDFVETDLGEVPAYECPFCEVWFYGCPTKYAPDVATVTSAEPDSGLESVPAVESDTQPRG